MIFDVTLDKVLPRFDQTDPAIQRQIVALFAAKVAVYENFLNALAKPNQKPYNDGLDGIRRLTRECLATEYKLK